MTEKTFNDGTTFDIREGYPTDGIVIKEIWEENVYEVDEGRFKIPGVTVDLGANIGAFSILAAKHGSKVLAVEPEPHSLIALENNIHLNNMQDRITIAPVGISNFNGTTLINDGGGGASIKDNVSTGSIANIITLEELFFRYDIDLVNVLKIDVEGSEEEIISGASRENLKKCSYITMEFDIRSGPNIGNIVKKLTETHHVRTMGSWERGGMIWAWLY
jgi:FkbM family methyltransferase